MGDCIFCKIISGDIKSHIIEENSTHVAFLSIFPSAEGNTVVVPKKHYSSCIYDQDDDVILELMKFTRIVARKLDNYFDTNRSAIVFEGYGVNHLHAKLIPLHGTSKDAWEPIESKLKHYMVEYSGYIVSADGLREQDEKLSKLAKQLREVR